MEWQVNRFIKFGEIVKAVESVYEAILYIRNEDSFVCSVLVSPYLEDNETVIDYSDCAFMQVWFNLYDTH